MLHFFRSDFPSVPPPWVSRRVDTFNFEDGRYAALLSTADGLTGTDLWTCVAHDQHAVALLIGLTQNGIKSVSRNPDRIMSLSQHLRVRAWHLEDALSARAGQWIPVSSVGVLPTSWHLGTHEPGIHLVSRRGVRHALKSITASQTSSIASTMGLSLDSIIESALGERPVTQHALVSAAAIDRPDRHDPLVKEQPDE